MNLTACLTIHKNFWDVETVVANVFDSADNINIEKLGLNVCTTLKTLAGNLFKVLTEGIDSVFEFAGKFKFFCSKLFVDIYADKLKELEDTCELAIISGDLADGSSIVEENDFIQNQGRRSQIQFNNFYEVFFCRRPWQHI